MMRVEEDLQESEGKLYTKDLVVQDCNSYIKQVITENYSQRIMDTIFQYLEKNNLLRTCREFLRECSDLKLPSPSFLNGKRLRNFLLYITDMVFVM